MPSKSKSKGNRFERAIVDTIQQHISGREAQRAWGSNGASLGLHEEVDVLINDEYKVQCKCRAKMAKWMKPNENVDIQIVKEDYGDIFVVLPYHRFLKIIKEKT